MGLNGMCESLLKAKFLSKDPFKRLVNDNCNLFKENLVNSMKKNIPQKKVFSR